MLIKKRILCPERLRKVPAQFSWVDHRLVRQRHIQRCDHGALALYLVLVTVADAEGLSYYSDESLERMLHLDRAGLCAARCGGSGAPNGRSFTSTAIGRTVTGGIRFALCQSPTAIATATAPTCNSRETARASRVRRIF